MALALAQEKSDVSFQVIERGQNAGEKSQGLKVLRTERAFQEYLKGRGEETFPKAFKEIDWAKEQVVVIYGGEQPTAGYGVEIKRINRTDIQRLNVEAILIRPRPNTIVAQMLTTPYVMFKMPREVAVMRVKFVLE